MSEGTVVPGKPDTFAASPLLRVFLFEHLRGGSTLVELGSGSGTVELAARYHVFSVEHDPAFLDLHGSTCIHAPITNGWYDRGALVRGLPKESDALLVDGPPEAVGRLGMLDHLDLFDLSRLVVVDDVHRPAELKLLRALAQRRGLEPELFRDGRRAFGAFGHPRRTVADETGPLSLAVAMTTAPRRERTLETSLASTRDAGFTQRVHVFAEPGTFPRPDAARLPEIKDDPNAIVHENPATRGCYGNWRYALEWLVQHTEAEWFLLLQDDVIWKADSAAVLRAEMLSRLNTRLGFLSPYTSPVVVDEKARTSRGWVTCRAGWNFWGALALCLKRPAALDLLKHPRFLDHPSSKALDAVVGASMLDLKRPSLVHVPSLADHIGKTSTIGRGSATTEWGRKGFGFDEGA